MKLEVLKVGAVIIGTEIGSADIEVVDFPSEEK